MRMLCTKTMSLLFVSLFLMQIVSAQVKIGGAVAETPHASAVLELKSTEKGVLFPRMTNQQMLDIPGPADALIVFNTDTKTVYIYSEQQAAWRALAADSSEWSYDPVSARVYLVKGYPKGDSIFYQTETQKWVFSDRTTNTNSIGQEFPVTDFSGKYYFKATASRFRDELNFNPTAVNVNFEVDSSGLHTGFRGLQIAAVNNPKNTQKLTTLNSLALSTIHAGADSLLSLTGISNSATINGTGGTTTMTGFTNSVNLLESSTKNIITMAGIRNNLNNVSPVSRVIGNVYGYFGSAFLLDELGEPTVDGSVYGIFLGNVSGAAPKRNYAFYSNKGHNRLGDSTLITDGFFNSPRAVLDINSTSAMIIPTGNTASRPVSAIAGMLRYNTINQTVEAYSGTQWNGILRGTTSIDLAVMNPASGTTISSILLTGATVGSAVTVSPNVSLPNGIVIAWARVTATDNVEIRFENNSGTAVDPPLVLFNIRVIQ